MRPDMAQVLIERPRSGSRMRGYRRQRRENRRTVLEERGNREAIHRRHGGRQKYSTDLFGPVIRFLARNVGRPWNKVYAEVCSQNDLRSVAQMHLRHHLFDFVECSVLMVDGVPYAANGRYPLGRFGRAQFYVCPRTGLLRQVLRQQIKPQVGNRIVVNNRLQYHRLEGHWCEVALRPIPKEPDGCWDAVLNKLVSRFKKGEALRLYGFGAYALSKRPLSKKETRVLIKETKRRLARKRNKRRQPIVMVSVV